MSLQMCTSIYLYYFRGGKRHIFNKDIGRQLFVFVVETPQTVNMTVQEVVGRLFTYIARSKQCKIHVSHCLIERQIRGSIFVRKKNTFLIVSLDLWKQLLCPIVEVKYRKISVKTLLLHSWSLVLSSVLISLVILSLAFLSFESYILLRLYQCKKVI